MGPSLCQNQKLIYVRASATHGAVVMNLIRLYSDAAGESHFGHCDLKMTLKQFAPPAAPLHVSEPQAAKAYLLLELPAGWLGEMHVSPKRQVMFCLSGSIKVTSSTHHERIIEPGMGLLMEDTTGKGHISEVISSVPATQVVIQQE
jgi:hypothetical protein